MVKHTSDPFYVGRLCLAPVTFYVGRLCLAPVTFYVGRLCLAAIILLSTCHGFNIGIVNHVTLRPTTTSDSYFGFSIAIMNSDNILVGSPRDNDTDLPGIDRPGRLYRCNISGQCSPLQIDTKTGDETIKGFQVSHGKHHQWLGATIALPPPSIKSIVTCAPRWYNAYHAQENYVKGMCYLIPTDFTTQEIVKLVSTNYTVKVNDTSFYSYGFSQMGMSAHYSANAPLLGAPGVFQWTGGFVSVNQIDRNNWRFLEHDTTNIPSLMAQYAGYAVTSGKFFSDGSEYFVVGAPRADLVGKVMLFRSASLHYLMEMPDVVLDGMYSGTNQSLPVNSYFGSVLCAMDVNGDNRDELLVGAPMFAENYYVETGMVLVYTMAADGVGFRTDHPALVGDSSPSARFGMTISSLGDINSDTFNDVIVGAPYADDLKGRVYVYNGYHKGVWPYYSQVIRAADIAVGLKGFGAAISNGFDVNGDKVNDVAVGAFLTDTVVLMFGQPVIDLEPSLNLRLLGQKVSYLQPNETEANVEVCFLYVFKLCPTLKITVSIQLDADRSENSRVVFGDNRMSKKEFHLGLTSNDKGCETSDKLVVKSSDDIISPIRIVADYSMTNEKVVCSTTVPPIIKRFDGQSADNSSQRLEQSVRFYNNCPNNTCNTDLHLAMSSEFTSISNFFILGTDNLVLNVKVTKDMHSAYGAVVHLVFSHYIRYKRFEKVSGLTDVTCFYFEDSLNKLKEQEEKMTELLITDFEQDEDKRRISCTIGNPLDDVNGVEIKIYLQVPNNIPVSEFDTQLTVSSMSKEINPSDNSINTLFQIRHHSDVTFVGISLDDTIRSSSDLQKFDHLFVLENLGPSILPEVDMVVYHPYSHKGDVANVFLDTLHVKCRKPCDVTCHLVELGGANNITTNINGRISTMVSRQPLTKTSKLDCSREECPNFRCLFTNIPAGYTAEVTIKTAVRGQFAADSLLVSRALVTVNTSTAVDMEGQHGATLTTRFLPRLPEPKGVAWWIIVVSIVCGLLIIALMIFIFYKVGFFKRQTRDDMQQRKTEKNEQPMKKIENSEKKDGDSFTDSEHDKLDKDPEEIDI